MYRLTENYESAIGNYLANNQLVTKYEITRLTPPADKYGITENAVVVYAELSAEEGSFVRMEVMLPEETTLDFVGLGNGSLAAVIRHTYLAIASDKHYIAMNCDLGTSRGVESGIKNPALWRDFGHRATHMATEVGKGIATAAYGKAPVYSAFCGGSSGGQQALSLCQRHPEDYNVIVAVAPANNRVGLHTYFLWNFRHLYDENGTPLFAREECESIRREFVALARADGDGEAFDNFITVSFAGADKVEKYVNAVCEKLSLTDKQKNALMAVYGGPVTSDGRRIYCGLPFGSELRGSGLALLSEIKRPVEAVYPCMWALGEDFDMATFSLDSDLDKALAIIAPDLNAVNPDLSEFFGKGGKLLLISGSADPCVPVAEAYAYAVNVAKIVGKDTADEHLRFFIAPSLDHRFAAIPDFLCGFVTAEDGRTLLDLAVSMAHGEALPDTLITEAKGDGDDDTVIRRISPLPLDNEEIFEITSDAKLK